MTQIPMFDYLSQYTKIEDEILDSVKGVFRSGKLILGGQVERFENRFSAFLDSEVQGVAVNSGTDALVVALMTFGIGIGDEVITVSNTAVPTVSAIRMTGATPVFCDVEADTGLIDLNLINSVITHRTKAVIAVHLFGNLVNIQYLRKLVEHRGIKIIEDCAQALGATYDGKMAGTLGDIAAFSFYPTKNLGAFGDGGICISKDHTHIKEMKRIRMYGFDETYYALREGICSRLDEVQAAVLNVKLQYLPKFIERRRYLSSLYEKGLDKKIVRMTVSKQVEHARHLYVVKVHNRKEVREFLTSRGISTGVHYPFPIHLMEGYSFLGYKAGNFPVTEMLANQILSLPLFPELTDDAVNTIIIELNEFNK
jgi:dTDP-4-amino-4,6-dideoxygalactose transaminase